MHLHRIKVRFCMSKILTFPNKRIYFYLYSKTYHGLRSVHFDSSYQEWRKLERTNNEQPSHLRDFGFPYPKRKAI